MTDILEDLKTLSKVSLFQTESIRKIESGLLTIDAGPEEAKAFSLRQGISPEVLPAALSIKEAIGRIHEVIHAIGILTALPHILEEGEQVCSVALAAGNTGRNLT